VLEEVFHAVILHGLGAPCPWTEALFHTTLAPFGMDTR
jgi:hypothetical protein